MTSRQMPATTYSDGKYTYLGRHQLLDAATSDGVPLAVVTLVPEGTFRSYEKHSQIAWFVGAVPLPSPPAASWSQAFSDRARPPAGAAVSPAK